MEKQPARRYGRTRHHLPELWLPALTGDLPAPATDDSAATLPRTNELVAHTEGRSRETKRAAILTPFEWDFHEDSFGSTEAETVRKELYPELAEHGYTSKVAIEKFTDGLDQFGARIEQDLIQKSEDVPASLVPHVLVEGIDPEAGGPDADYKLYFELDGEQIDGKYALRDHGQQVPMFHGPGR